PKNTFSDSFSRTPISSAVSVGKNGCNLRTSTALRAGSSSWVRSGSPALATVEGGGKSGRSARLNARNPTAVLSKNNADAREPAATQRRTSLTRAAGTHGSSNTSVRTWPFRGSATGAARRPPETAARPRQRLHQHGWREGLPRPGGTCWARGDPAIVRGWTFPAAADWQRQRVRAMRPAVIMAGPAADPIVVERAGGVTTLRLDRPKALNALDPDTLLALGRALDEVDSDGSARCVVITGTGERAFSAGADIAAMAAMGPTEGHAYSRLGHAVLGRLDDLRVPSIAAVNGVALGGGLELALACDLVVAGERARLGLPEITLGLIPGFGGTQRLVRRCGLARARELVYLGTMVGAAEALRLGIVDRVVPDDRLADEAAALAGELATRAPLA